jgi:mRNA-degrading endonuclease HigB of HigAB toxin-antitoxin module
MLQSMKLLGELVMVDFRRDYPQAGKSLNCWVAVVRASAWHSFDDVKRTFHGADDAAPNVLFDIDGNRVRIVVSIDFKESVVIVRTIMRHGEQEEWED